GAGHGKAEGAVEDGAAEADDQGLRHPDLRAAADLGAARHARLRLPAEGLAQPRPGHRRGNPLYSVRREIPPTLTLPRKGGGNCLGPPLTSPSPLAGEGRGGG